MAAKPQPWSCETSGHEFFRVSDDRVACAKCGEFRSAVTFAPAPPYYVPVPYTVPYIPSIPWQPEPWVSPFWYTSTSSDITVSGGTSDSSSLWPDGITVLS